MDNKTQQPDNFNLPQPVSEAAGPMPLPVAQPGTPLQPQTAAPVGLPPSNGSMAGDTDSIEPTWTKAVQTLKRQYVADPKRFSEEFSKLKARYIKERYNMEIKSSQAEGSQT